MFAKEWLMKWNDFELDSGRSDLKYDSSINAPNILH